MELEHRLFRLPAPLDAKAQPLRIGPDQAHLSAVAEAMSTQRAELAQRLDELRRAPGGRGRAAMDRDLEIHRHSARLRLLRRFGSDLCLGRMTAADSSVVYVGRLGLTAPSGVRLLVDWRTPAAEPFFAATPAHPMGLRSRRRYRWQHGAIVDYWDEVFTDDVDPATLALDADAAFLAGLGSSRSTRMRDVLATIASDQDAIVRADATGPLVVDGGPGTGKTVVALHRAAYLLYADPHLSAGRGRVLLVGPHRSYLSYVADVLPGLGEEGVLTCTIADLVAEGATAAPEADPRVADLKSSIAMVEAIEPAVGLYEELPDRRILIETDWADVWLEPRDWLEAVAGLDPTTPHNEALTDLREQLLTILIDKIEDSDGDVPNDQVRRGLARSPEFRAAVERTWTVIEAAELVSDLWSVPAYLRRCAPWLSTEARGALRRPEGSPWTRADLPLLDAARHRLGDPEAGRRRRRREAAEAAERAAMDRVVDDLLAADDDPEGSMQLLRRASIRDSLVAPDALPPEPLDRLAGPFAHVLVDEAQELTDAEWQMLVRRCPSRSFTVIGDRAQARRGFAESWADRLARIGLPGARTSSLHVNYRTPEEVMAVAEPAIREALPDANVPTSVRRSGVPVTYGATADLGAVVERWLFEHQDGVGCVIGAPYPDEGRVRGMTPEEVKGLEFDLVVLVEPESFGAGTTGAVDRYVAMTRTTDQLVILGDRV